MIELKPNDYRRQLILASPVQRFIRKLDSQIKLRKLFFCHLRDTLKGRSREERPRLEELIITSQLIANPIELIEKIDYAAQRQTRDSPLHKFLLDYRVIANALVSYCSDKKVWKNLINSGIKTQVFEKVFVSLCPNACFFVMDSKPTGRCKRCNEKTTVFPFYRVEKDILNAWKENVLFEAWVCSLLKRNDIRCEVSMEILRNGITSGEVDLIIDEKFIVEMTREKGFIEIACELLGKNIFLGKKYQPMLLHCEKLDEKLKKNLQGLGIIVIDNATSDPKFDRKLLRYLRS